MQKNWLVAVVGAMALSLGGLGCANQNGAGAKCEKCDTHAKHHEESKDDDESSEVEITADAVPAAVKAGFAKEFPGATITKAEKETYKNGTIHYEIDFKKADGAKADAEFDADGELLPEH